MRKGVTELLCRVSKDSPHLILYPATVGCSGNNLQRDHNTSSKYLLTIMNLVHQCTVFKGFVIYPFLHGVTLGILIDRGLSPPSKPVTPAKNAATDLSQFFQFYQVATSLLKSGMLQLIMCRLVVTCWKTSFDHQLATSLLTTCNRLVVNKLSQALRTLPDIRLLITSLLQDVNTLVFARAFLAV